MNAGFTQPTAVDEAAVRAVEAAYDFAWNAGDLASLLQLLTDGVVITNPYGETGVGRDEAELFFSALFNGVGKGSRHASQIRGVHFVDPRCRSGRRRSRHLRLRTRPKNPFGTASPMCS